jgi:hypothetical protein
MPLIRDLKSREDCSCPLAFISTSSRMLTGMVFSIQEPLTERSMRKRSTFFWRRTASIASSLSGKNSLNALKRFSMRAEIEIGTPTNGSGGARRDRFGGPQWA